MSVRKPKFKNIETKTLDSLIKHQIAYERWMMREAFKLAVAGGPGRVRQNLNVEGVAVHARNLIEFLKNGESCSFNPADFTTHNWSVKNFIRPKLIEMINQQISHLTVGRTEVQDEKFGPEQWQETVEAVETELNRWIANLQPEWAEKWDQRDRMGDDPSPGFFNTRGHVDGATNHITSVLSESTATAAPHDGIYVVQTGQPPQK